MTKRHDRRAGAARRDRGIAQPRQFVLQVIDELLPVSLYAFHPDRQQVFERYIELGRHDVRLRAHGEEAER